MRSVFFHVVLGCFISVSCMHHSLLNAADKQAMGAEKTKDASADKLNTATKTDGAAVEKAAVDMTKTDTQTTATKIDTTVFPNPSETEFIDTIDIGAEGNWLLKRKWYEKAQDIYERISNVLDQILSLRMPFFVKRSELDKLVFDPFYLEIGLDRGELEEAVNSLITKMNQERELQGALDKHELEILDQLQKEKTTLEQLQKDIDEVVQADHDVDDALAELMKQIDKCRAWQQEAWSNFKDIAKELSDKKAEELCYAMEAQEANVIAILGWIKGEFTTHFEDRIKKAQDQTVRIKEAVVQLKAKGIDLKSQVQRVDERSEKERLEAATEKAAEEALEQAEAEAQARRGFFGGVVATIKSAIVSVWNFIVYCVKSVYHWITEVLGFTASESDEESESAEEESSTLVETTTGGVAIDQTTTERISPEETVKTEEEVIFPMPNGTKPTNGALESAEPRMSINTQETDIEPIMPVMPEAGK